MEALPYRLAEVVAGFGSEIRIAPRAEALRQYWSRFAPLSRYEIRFAPREGLTPLLTTKNPEQVVGAIVASKDGGHLVLLPALDLGPDDDAYDDYEDDAEEAEGDSEGDEDEDHAAFRLNSIDFVHRLLEVDALLREGPLPPPPDWAQVAQHQTAAQRRLQQALLRAQEEEAQARQRRQELEVALDDASLLQSLLFAQGTPLEDAVLCGLKLMGIEAARVVVGDSEFDSVFAIDGRRMLGEAEGRDRAAIGIDKITQLERNVAEDFARDDVTEHAHGVLFGNPQRLTAPKERTKTFTEKCMSSAKRNGFALVLTHTMFEPVDYLEVTGDLEYAAACRAAIAAAKGEVVKFPDVPETYGSSRDPEAAGAPGDSK